MAALRRQAIRFDPLLLCLAACAAATLIHHVHNAEFLDQYPNMPAWLSPLGVYAAWLGASLVGVAGYLLLRFGLRLPGLALLFAYGCYALDGLAHYAVAPMSSHTTAMNLTIWLEAATGMALLIALLYRRTG
jgi:hypothetical protein